MRFGLFFQKNRIFLQENIALERKWCYNILYLKLYTAAVVDFSTHTVHLKEKNI